MIEIETVSRRASIVRDLPPGMTTAIVDRMRGQSTIEYLLGLTVIILGVMAVVSSSRLYSVFETIYIHCIHRIGTDAVLPEAL